MAEWGSGSGRKPIIGYFITIASSSGVQHTLSEKAHACRMLNELAATQVIPAGLNGAELWAA
jgi:hypothetical protein